MQSGSVWLHKKVEHMMLMLLAVICCNCWLFALSVNLLIVFSVCLLIPNKLSGRKRGQSSSMKSSNCLF